jgi:F0F1-type ATP synthase membrane subunit c/vacuolar-type H+-ATPase subunit K
MEHAVKLVGAGIAMIGSTGAGIGIGLIFSAWINAIARNPAMESRVRPVALMGFALAELVLLMCFVIAVLLMFVV